MTRPDVADRHASETHTEEPAPAAPHISPTITRPPSTSAPDSSAPDTSATITSTPSTSTPSAGPVQLTVLPWWEPHLAVAGVDPRDPYVERFWLGILGPSTVLLLRRFARGLEEHPSGIRVGILDTSLALGLGRGTGRNAPITRTINRAIGFGLLRPITVDRMETRTHLPLLSPRNVRQLPPGLRHAHAEWLDARASSRASAV